MVVSQSGGLDRIASGRGRRLTSLRLPQTSGTAAAGSNPKRHVQEKSPNPFGGETFFLTVLSDSYLELLYTEPDFSLSPVIRWA